MIHEPLLSKARSANAKLAEAERQVQTIRAEYHSIVRRLHLAGASLREIALALEVSHQRIQQMVGDAGGSWWRRAWRSRNAKRNLTCTFCERSQDIVTKLIAGPNVFICDACVAVAEKSMGEISTAPLALTRQTAKARCSFCRKRSTTDRPVFKASAASICARCLNVCHQILMDSGECGRA